MRIDLLRHQAATLQSKKKYIGLTSGIGGGKTWTGVHWVIKKSLETPKALGFIGANTYSQLRNSTLSAVFNELMRLEIDFDYNQSSGRLTVFEKEWLCKSMDNFDVIRGIEVGEIWLDECAYMKEEAFNVIIGRLRDKHGSLQVLMTTTPKGYNWFYHHMHPDGEQYIPELAQLIKAKSTDNTFLPEGYIQSLEKQYDEKFLKQELEGEFLNIAQGQIYYGFDKNINVKTFERERYPIWVGMDFNPHKMSAVIGYLKGEQLYIFDEIYDTTTGANTEKVCKEIILRYGKHVTVVPDSTGIKATSNASRSDIQVIKDCGLKVNSTHNPYRIDRYASVNAVFSKQIATIHPSCKNLIKDLEEVVYKEGTDKPETTNPHHTHMSDAFGYLVYKTVNPLVPRYKSHITIS